MPVQATSSPAPLLSTGSFAGQSRFSTIDKNTGASMGMASRPMLWLMLIIGCVVIIAILLVIDRIINT